MLEKTKTVLLNTRNYIFDHKKTSVAGLIVLLVGGYLIYAYAIPKPTTTQYIASNPTRQTLIQSVSETGTVSLLNLKNLNFTSAGTVNKVNFKIGDKLKAGDVIATIDKTNLQNTLAQSQSPIPIPSPSFCL